MTTQGLGETSLYERENKEEKPVEKLSQTKLKYIQGNDRVVVKFDRGK